MNVLPMLSDRPKRPNRNPLASTARTLRWAAPPALTIMSMTVMGAVFGVAGLLLATPLVAVALVREAYVEDVLERRNDRGKLM